MADQKFIDWSFFRRGGGFAGYQTHPFSTSRKTIAPSNPLHVEKNFQASLDEIEEKGKAKVILSGREFTIKKQFLEDLFRYKNATVHQRIEKASAHFSALSY